MKKLEENKPRIIQELQNQGDKQGEKVKEMTIPYLNRQKI